MRRAPLPLVEALDGRDSEPSVNHLVHEREGDGIVMPVELDVVVDVDACVSAPVIEVQRTPK
jgi:hypothetical protein